LNAHQTPAVFKDGVLGERKATERSRPLGLAHELFTPNLMSTLYWTPAIHVLARLSCQTDRHIDGQDP